MTDKSPEQIRKERMPIYEKIVRYMWIALGAALVGSILIFLILSFSDLPDTQELENPRSELATEIYASNGEVLGRFFIENRVPVSYNELSPELINALIATEDERYFKHSGIDLEALGRVIFKTAILRQKSSGGGSTITQQLAKLLFTRTPSSNLATRIIQKLKEWIIAVQLERKYTKEEIIAMYLNKFDFLYESDGIKAAAEIYFGKSQDTLLVEEAAVLVGMLKNPSLYNPFSHPENALGRREVVLKQMVNNDLLTQEVYDSLRQTPIDMGRFVRKTHNDGLAPYFRGELSKEVSRILQGEDARKPDGTTYNLYRDGLKIYTSIDPVVQKLMEDAARTHMAKLQETWYKHWENRDPWTYADSETTKEELESRQRKKTRMIRSSERYEAISERYLSKSKKKLLESVEGLQLRDVDIDRLISAQKDDQYLATLVKQNMITDDMRKEYQRALKDSAWVELKTQFEIMAPIVDSVFNKPVSMKVFTYENAQMEKDTVMSPLDSLIYHHNFLQIGSLAVDPHTGHVKGWVGGINYRYFKYDHINSRRQVGSTFKPFVYATAIAKQGFSPCFQVYDLPQTIFPGEGNFQLLQEWTPANSEGEYSGDLLTLKEGLAKSKNTVSVFLMKQLSDTEPVRDLVHNMGIDKYAKYPNGRYVVPKQPSICLGATDLSVFEMTGAYTTFANNGIYTHPVFITKIEDRNGRVIYTEDHTELRALDERANYVMVEMLRYAGRPGLWEIKSDMGGKTGTTNDYVDGWYMGITPNLVVGTWVGGEDRWIRFRNITYGQGAYMAKPFFREFMKGLEAAAEAGESDYNTGARFFLPRGDLGIELNCDLYLPGGDGEEGQPSPGGFGPGGFGDETFDTPTDSTKKRQPPGGN
ncbi:MAG: transglycosylase domain-containing protein [Saprospiraceae bacterium]|nr:transglycosylase domain-containing protein [Saprospiraceae bacterium]